MAYLTIEDLRDVYIKTLQRGSKFIMSKFSFNDVKRTKSAFNELNIVNANWWNIPHVRNRWNKLITGNENTSYEYYLSESALKNKNSLVSIGSGVCSHELLLAELNPHLNITCIDLAGELLHKAETIAQQKKLTNISFIEKNIYEQPLPTSHFDIVFFHASLHHFKNMESFIPDIVKNTLKPNGLLIINEYVGPNRMIYNKHQRKAINECLKLIPKKYKSIYKTNLIKNHYYGSGVLRMIIADPSECIDSKNILPTIHKHFNTIEEKPYGGNILMSVFKDISHHFMILDKDKKNIINTVFEFEDRYLDKVQSDFVFGIYQKKLNA